MAAATNMARNPATVAAEEKLETILLESVVEKWLLLNSLEIFTSF